MVTSSSSLAISCATSPKTRGFSKSYKKNSDLWQNYRSMLKAAVILGFCLVALLVPVSAQKRKGPPQASRFDQFTQIRHCDLGARLDNFAIQLQNQPSAKGAIVSYAPEGDGPGTGKRILEMLKDYLVNAHGLAPDRIETIYGGRNSEIYQPSTELWVVPEGARLPKPKKYETQVANFQGLWLED